MHPIVIKSCAFLGLFIKSLFYFLFLYLLCEYYIFYIILTFCSWPKLNPDQANLSINGGEEPVKAMFITDLHLLLDETEHNSFFQRDQFNPSRMQWHMHRSFKTAVILHKPEVVFVLGDITEIGLWCNEIQCKQLASLFHRDFSVPNDVKLYVVAGNHDVGFHKKTSFDINRRFLVNFNAPLVQMVTIRNNHFILLNSAALENDGCPVCTPAEHAMKEIQSKLECSKSVNNCDSNAAKVEKYSRPILIQHIPFYRPSDEHCTGIDAAPESRKYQPFWENMDCLNRKVSERILSRFDPRIAFAGHVHHGCVTRLPNNGTEYTLSPFNLRLNEKPMYTLALFTPNNHALQKCQLLNIWIPHFLYAVGILLYLSYLIYCYVKQRKLCTQYVIVNNK